MIDRQKHLLRLADWSEERILETVDIACRLKAEVHSGNILTDLKASLLVCFSKNLLYEQLPLFK